MLGGVRVSLAGLGFELSVTKAVELCLKSVKLGSMQFLFPCPFWINALRGDLMRVRHEQEQCFCVLLMWLSDVVCREYVSHIMHHFGV